MIVLDGKRIIRMTLEGIAYLDEEAFEHFIYFGHLIAKGRKATLRSISISIYYDANLN